jgi:hypothetical protein
MPTARSIARAGARWSPSVTSLLRGLRLLLTYALPLQGGSSATVRGKVSPVTEHAAAAGAPERFGPERAALLPVLVWLLATLPLATSHAALAWLLLLPLAAAVWVLRARVVVDAERVLVNNGLGTRAYAWDDVRGLDLPRRGPARLALHDGGRPLLSALPRRRVRALLALAPPEPPAR